MRNNSLISYVIIFLLVIVVSFLLTRNNNYKNLELRNIEHVVLGGVKLKVLLALTPEAQAEGLSGRSDLREDTGMLFVFNQSGKYYFWMKNMNFPIDMIWVSEDRQIIYIKKNAEPDNFLETYGPDQNAKYVLETVAGFSDKNNLKEGDRVEFTY